MHNLTMRYVSGNLAPNDPLRDAFGGSSSSSDLSDVCLVSALRSLDVPVPYTTSGPFRALAAADLVVLRSVPWPRLRLLPCQGSSALTALWA